MRSSIYGNQILKLKKEGKTYLEIVEILGCSKSTVSYNSSNKQKERAKKWREENNDREKRNKSTRVSSSKSKQRNREYVNNFLKDKRCVDCGNSDHRVLDFDHVLGDKIGAISTGIKDSWSLDKLQKEIDKCEIRCSNCHRIITYERRKTKMSESSKNN